jgi:hypothetical protein
MRCSFDRLSGEMVPHYTTKPPPPSWPVTSPLGVIAAYHNQRRDISATSLCRYQPVILDLRRIPNNITHGDYSTFTKPIYTLWTNEARAARTTPDSSSPGSPRSTGSPASPGRPRRRRPARHNRRPRPADSRPPPGAPACARQPRTARAGPVPAPSLAQRFHEKQAPAALRIERWNVVLKHAGHRRLDVAVPYLNEKTVMVSRQSDIPGHVTGGGPCRLHGISRKFGKQQLSSVTNSGKAPLPQHLPGMESCSASTGSQPTGPGTTSSTSSSTAAPSTTATSTACGLSTANCAPSSSPTKARPKNASAPTSGAGQAPHWKHWKPAGHDTYRTGTRRVIERTVDFRYTSPQVSDRLSTLEQLAGHDHALDLVGALVDLGDSRAGGSFRR